MVVSNEASSPFYISSHSADVILSDIRPIKLKIDALRSINVFLDEFLFTILKASRSLTTTKLRDGLLATLPTNLGKEALLEAEVELRAYWDRTKRPKGVNAAEDDSDSFNLQWAFELLRLKCEAYSTLNEVDEDPAAESRLHERMAGTSGSQSPKPSLVAPAALYLTAILEAMCEHILSNVGRVAARDSSRTTATLNDVFVALCEDDSIYSLFKSMNVYEQIKQQSQEPRPKSISRTDKVPVSRTSSGDRPASRQGSSPPTRFSQESAPTSGVSGPRSSLEKAKSMKKLIGSGRNSTDRDSASINGHKKSESILSDQTKHTWAAFTQADDDSSLQEFDDLMRSDSTMKVSLTPDRLKTMEVYKQEKQERDQRVNGNQQRSSDSTSSHTSRTDNRRPSVVRNVDSIQEDEEESQNRTSSSAAPPQRLRQTSVTSPPKPSGSSRTRSISAASASIPGLTGRKSSKSGIASPPPPPLPTMHAMEKRPVGIPMGFGGDPYPPRTRKIQHNRESLDLDEVMAGSDGEDNEVPVTTPKSATPIKRPAARSGGVSASTRELMDFLNEGPPETPARPYGRPGRELSEFMENGASDFGLNESASSKKGSGRLQRMMSKLSIGGSDKDKARNEARNGLTDDLSRKLSQPISPPTPIRNGVSPKTSAPNLSMLANRPIPPRPPQQPQTISPPLSPVTPDDTPQSTQSYRPQASRKTPAYDLDISNTSSAPPSPAISSKVVVIENGYTKIQGSRVVENTRVRNMEATKDSPRSSAPSTPDLNLVAEPKVLPKATPPPSIQTSRKPPMADVPTSQAVKPPMGLSKEEVQELRRHISRATTSDECRLVMDIFLAKAGVPVEPTEHEVPYPSPSPTDTADQPSSADLALEHTLVELFLGGSDSSHEPPAPRKKKYSSKKTPPAIQPFKANGHAPLPETALKA